MGGATEAPVAKTVLFDTSKRELFSPSAGFKNLQARLKVRGWGRGCGSIGVEQPKQRHLGYRIAGNFWGVLNFMV